MKKKPKIIVSGFQTVPIKSISRHPRNPRKGRVSAIRESLRENEFYSVILVQKGTNFIVAGNHRWEAARKEGLTEVPVAFVDCDDTLALRILLADNRTSDVAGYDTELLVQLLEEIERECANLAGTGYEEDDLAKLRQELGKISDAGAGSNEVPDAPQELIVKSGELWELGSHRLICGDCTDPKVVKRLMGASRAILCATDPPYKVSYTGENHPHQWGKGKGKNKSWEGSYGTSWDDASADPDLFDGALRLMLEHAAAENAAFYWWHASRRQAMIEELWEKHGLFVHQTIQWIKDRPILTRSWYSWQSEPCFFGWRKGSKPPRRARDYPSNVWHVPTIAPGTVTSHPTSKPTELFEIPMRQHTRKGELCFEPFAGSGSQIIAAEKLERICYAAEISAEYCSLIVRRWEKFSGKKAEVIHGTR